MIPEYGGNLFNIEPVRDRVAVNFGDVCDRLAMNWLVRDQDYVFHLAGQVSHVMSMTDPFPDIEFNIKGTAVVMEAVRHHNPTAKVVFTGTRGQYGPASQLPVSETAPTNPKAIYEVSNLTAEKIIQVYHQTHGIPAVLLRLTNIYGPRAQMRHSQYGVVNWFVRQALDGEPIRVFGTGQHPPRLRLRRRLRGRDPRGGDVRRGRRRDLQRRLGPADVVPGAGADAGTAVRRVHVALRPVLAGAGGPGAGRLLLGHHQDSHGRRLGAANEPGGRAAADARLLPAASGPLLGIGPARSASPRGRGEAATDWHHGRSHRPISAT